MNGWIDANRRNISKSQDHHKCLLRAISHRSRCLASPSRWVFAMCVLKATLHVKLCVFCVVWIYEKKLEIISRFRLLTFFLLKAIQCRRRKMRLFWICEHFFTSAPLRCCWCFSFSEACFDSRKNQASATTSFNVNNKVVKMTIEVYVLRKYKWRVHTLNFWVALWHLKFNV